MTIQKVKVKTDQENPEPIELIAKSIIDIAEAMRKINSARLTREALVILIHDYSKVSKVTIRIVLNNLDALESTYLKKKS